MEIIGVIYKIIDLSNDKIYVGQTKQKLSERFGKHKKTDSLIGRAIRKHGEDNFKIEVIEECQTIDELNEREIFWIAKLRACW